MDHNDIVQGLFEVTWSFFSSENLHNHKVTLATKCLLTGLAWSTGLYVSNFSSTNPDLGPRVAS